MQDLYRALCSLSIYRDMLSADPVRALSAFLRTGGAEQAGALCACLARLHCADSLPRAVLQQMQEQINPYTLALAKGETPEATVARNAARDRGILYAAATAALCGDDMPVYGTALPPAPFDRPWDRAEEAFAAFHAAHGCGPFTRHTAFLWQGERLVPVTRTDPVRLSSLHGYDAQQRVLVRNTQAFLAGRPANHILLYGDRGTGKSSSVKALLKASGFPGMRVLQFGFNPNFADNDHLPHRYSRNSVCYTGTHDNSTVIGWFKSADKKSRAMCKRYLKPLPFEKINHTMIRELYKSQAGIAIVPMQDIIGLDDSARMNIPSTLGGNWNWRAEKKHFDAKSAAFMKDLALTYYRLVRKPKQKQQDGE